MYVSWFYPSPFHCKFISRAQTKALDRAVRANTEFSDEIHTFRDSTRSKHGFGRDGDLYRGVRRLPFCRWLLNLFLNWKNRLPPVGLLRRNGFRCKNRFRSKSLDGGGRSSRSDCWARVDARTLEGKEQHGGGKSNQCAGHRRNPTQHVGVRLGRHQCIAIGIEGFAYLLIPIAFGPALLTRLDVSRDFGSLVLWKFIIEPGD